LLGVGAGPDLEVVIRAPQPEVGEEHLAHLLVVVLAGVDQVTPDVPPFERP
jgi:hypothetical protein